MSDLKEEVPTKGTSKVTKTKRLKPKQVPLTMKYKFQGNPVPSKFGSEVMNITDTLVGHIDLEQFCIDTFS